VHFNVLNVLPLLDFGSDVATTRTASKQNWILPVKKIGRFFLFICFFSFVRGVLFHV